MSLRYVLDENLRGPLWQAVVRHNVGQDSAIDAICVGQTSDLPLGVSDAVLLHCAEENGRILVTRDRRTLPAIVKEHIAAGNHTPGVFILKRRAEIRTIVEYLALASALAAEDEFQDRIEYIP